MRALVGVLLVSGGDVLVRVVGGSSAADYLVLRWLALLPPVAAVACGGVMAIVLAAGG